jgi:asparagine synthase (glutamine-hydrolysing)
MCGISGIIRTGRVSGLEESLIAMRHRGPDANGTWRGAVGKYNVGLGHLRLSIVDLSPSSNQPFISDDGLLILTFNGEIYNYRALREELRALGHRFKTESDTEVLLNSYAEWGVECVCRFDGMFAFAILDRERRQLYLARDPLGIKPLYVWTDNESSVAFASEIRGLRPLANQAIEPDPATFAEFLLNGWLYEPNTGFRSVHKIMPGEFRTIDLDSGAMKSTIYYDPLSRPAPKSSFDELLADSVGLQRLADVNVGLFYSGGLDSSVLAAASDDLEGLFVDYSGETGPNDDSIYAKPIADCLGLQFRTIRHDAATDDPESIIADFQHVARGTEELISDYTYSASDLLSHNARAAGYKVMLSGMGGDELFAGYPRYILARYRKIVRSFLPAVRLTASAMHKYPSMEKRMERLLRFSADGRFIRAYTSLIGYFSEQEVSRLLGTTDACEQFWGWTETIGKKVKHLSPLKQAMYMDRFGFLSHNLMVTDKSSMANSIEMRVPLTSNALAELGFSLPDGRLLDYRGGKIPLRSLLRKRLSDDMVNRPKAGFNPPLDGKIAVLGYGRIADILTHGPISHVVDGVFSCDIVKAHFSGAGNQTYKIWQLLYFNFWLEEANLAVIRPASVSDQAF